MEFEIAELRKQEPQESKFRYLNDQFVCCSCHSDSDSEEEYQLDEDGQVHVVQTPNKVWSDESVPIPDLCGGCSSKEKTRLWLQKSLTSQGRLLVKCWMGELFR